ncbi:TNT domain-containing protein [Nocardioides mangrovi]|uniref:TNT domain-containing protein n=1 Tax=Nocardioides mangrovi TaxID=2874580 RepID=A0ABS7UGP9_9ACTN|nr:TNT domain-containing protein [Nocardioides mangrovi]MBZ5739798.1 TNT domain-containing protein [Nocardioides mangrovi]
MSDPDAVLATVRDRLAAAGLPPQSVYVSGPPTPDTPPPPEGPWVVVPWAGGYAVGGLGRGKFAIYAVVPGADETADLVVHLRSTPAPSEPAPSDEVLAEAGAQTARGITARTAERGGAAGPAALTVDDVVDVFGPETGHHLYALGTPYPQRSQPPSDLGDYHRYRVVRTIPDAMEGVAAPWFEQPGGGAMVVTERPIRWYVDQGYLVELV